MVCLAELGEQPGDEILESPAKPVFAGKKHSQPEGQKCGKKQRGHEAGSPEVRGAGLVTGGEFSEVYFQPRVVREVVELDMLKESHGDGLGCESPGIGVAAEFEAGD